MAASTEAVRVHVTHPVAPVQRDEPALRFVSLDGRSVSWPPVCEAQGAEDSQSGGPWLRVVGRGVALPALLRHLVERWADGSRERGLSQDARRGASRCRCAADIGGQRMTRPQRRPASLRAFPEPGLVLRWPGAIACLGGFGQRCGTERRSGSARSRSVRSGVELSCAKADESGALGAEVRVQLFTVLRTA
jgi:hypothetical protein